MAIKPKIEHGIHAGSML